MKNNLQIKDGQKKQINRWWIPYILSGIRSHLDVNISFIQPNGEEHIVEPLQNAKPTSFERKRGGLWAGPFNTHTLTTKSKGKTSSLFLKKILSLFHFSKTPSPSDLKNLQKIPQKNNQRKAFKGYFILCSCTWFPLLIGSTYLGVLKVSTPLEEETSKKIRSYIDAHLFQSLKSL